MEKQLVTIRQMLEDLKGRLEALGFMMVFVSFHPADEFEKGSLVINLAGYQGNLALMVGVSFHGGSDGVIIPPHFDLLGEFKFQEAMLPGDMHDMLSRYGHPSGGFPQFGLRLTENEITEEDLVVYVGQACLRIENLVNELKDRLSPSFTTDLSNFEGFVPRYSDEHKRRYLRQEGEGGLGWTYADRPYIWSALLLFPPRYINYKPLKGQPLK